MKLIGVMGNGGSGKTTFTNYLGEKKNVGVIHVDDYVGEIKKKYFRIFLQPKENNTTEATRENPKLKTDVKAFFYRNKLAFKFLMALRSKLVEDSINKQIEDFKRNGKKVIIIDDWALPTHKKLLPKLSQIYSIKRGFISRREGLQERDGLDRKELRVSDLPYATGSIKEPTDMKVIEIHNNGSFESLFEKAEQEYEKIGELTFDERYSLKDKDNIKIAAEKLRKARQIAQENKTTQSRQFDD